MRHVRYLGQLSASDTLLASGKGADLGGALSHGSIIAREYGIPAVMGTGNVTERIRNGQVITVDGAAGEVYLGRS